MSVGTVAGTKSLEGKQGVWVLDPAHTSIELVARHLMVTKVRGRFEGFEGAIHVAEDPLESWAVAKIDASTITTGVEQRDGHLRSPDFLSVEEFPHVTFRSTGLEHLSGSDFKARGELTIRGVSKEIELDVTFGGTAQGMAGEVAFFSATGDIDREDFGIVWNQPLESGGVLVSKKIRFEIEAQAVRSES